MTIKKELAALSVGALLILNGCDKNSNSESVSPPAKESESTATKLKAAASGAASELKATAQQATADARATAGRIQAQVTQTASNSIAAAGPAIAAFKDETEQLIEKARLMVKDQRWEDAVKNLKELSRLNLSPEQKQAVEDLKRQVQSLSNQAVTNASSAINQLFRK
ncbi:MAG TPA: hypothetical protein VEH04_15805 [Verrucomicrobiae bacterium]|nr:hypothetical protein [Verrucomicrobiae bacterium]